MKTSPSSLFHHHLRLILLIFALVFFAASSARAGLTFTLNLVRYYPNGYYFNAYLNTNTTAPGISNGTYLLALPHYPTNGNFALYQFDTNGFNQTGGFPYGFYGDFDSLTNELTTNIWSIFVTNSVTTNVYTFKVTSSLASNNLPLVSITFPTDGAVNVTNQPNYKWNGPTNYSELVAYGHNFGIELPIIQTNLPSPSVLYQGINNLTVHYYSNSATALVASIPLDNASQPISSWDSTVHLDTYYTSQFTVGTVDLSGTSHTLVAHYAWDGTNGDGTASGADTSGNGYDLNFGGGQGGQGGVNSSADPAAGPRAIQFHDGDGNSAGYVGWNPTPAGLLTALSGSFSVSCWIKTTQNNFGGDQNAAYNGAGIIAADNGGQANDVIPMALTGSKIGFGTGGDSDITLNSSAAVNDGNYHHVVVTRNQQTGQKIIYIDGVLDSFSSGTTDLLNDPQKLTLGALADAGDPDASDGGYYNGYDGKLDDVQIYSGVLSAGDVAGLFANPGSTVANGGGTSGGHRNVAHYAFEDGSSTFQLGVDSSTNANNLVTYSYWGPVHTNSATAAAGTNAVQFFGTSSMVCYDQVLTNLNAVLAGSFTFSAWVKTTTSRGNDYDNAYYGNTIFWAFNDHGNTNDTIPLAITGSKAAFTTRGGDSGSFDNLHSLTSVNDGNYHLITVTRDGATGEKKIYVDGNFEASEFGTTNPLNGNNYYLSVGGTTSSSYTGLLDDLQIYSGVLSDGEVADLYNNPGVTVADVAGTGGDFATALNTTNLSWSTGGNLPWFTETTVTHDGLAAQSGAITNNQSSYLQTTVPADGQLSFNWKVSSEGGADFLTFNINGNEQDAISGDVDWNRESYSVSAGDVLRWEYSKDGSDSNGLDAGFLDQISFVTAPILVVTASPQSGAPTLMVQFTSPGVDSTGHAVTNWNWNFGDGGTSTNQNPVHGYNSVGNYSPSLTAYSTFGSSPLLITGLGTISVAIPSLNASASPQTGQAPLTVQFSTPSQDSYGFTVTNWNWTFGDGATSTAQNPAHTYLNPGMFSPGLIARSTYGASPVTIVYGFSLITVTNPPNPFFHILHSFTAASGNPSTNGDGTGPNGGMVLSGNTLYGTTQHGGGSGYGTLFALNTDGSSFTNLYNFSLATNSGGIPPADVILSGDKFFGTAAGGGTRGGGTIFAINTNGLGYTNLFNYNSSVDPNSGSQPLAAVTLAGNTLYGTTWFGGAFNHGTLSYVTTNGVSSGIFHHFSNPSGPDANLNYDGLFPSSKLIFSGGTLYGTAEGGGNFASGTVFAVDTNNPGSFRILHYFSATTPQYTGTNTDGASPFAGLALSGNTLYGTTFHGGSLGYGTVYAVNLDGSGFTNLYNFTGSNGDYGPHTSLILSGNILYGTTSGGGLLGSLSSGTLFAINTDGSGYRNLYSFSGGSDGAGPQGELVLSGNTLYGAAAGGGDAGKGTVFSFTLPATALRVTLLTPASSGGNFSFTFLSQAGFNHSILYRTNLTLGNWLTNSTVTGDGTLKTNSVPLSIFSPAKQGFIRVSTQ